MKKITTAALAAMMLMSSTALAAEFPNFDFNGDLSVHYRWNASDVDGGKTTFRLNATSELSPKVTLFTRFATQKLSVEDVGQADFDTTHYDGDRATTIDRFGFSYKNAGFNYNIGRQGVTLGTGLIADTTGYMGVNLSAIDGVVATGKVGVTNLQVVAGELWEDVAQDAKIYSINASYSPAKNWTLGATVAKAKEGDTLNFYGVNAAYEFSKKANAFVDYVKSDADAEDTAYAIGMNYTFDKKNSAYAIYSKTETGSVLGGFTAYDYEGKGMYYGFNHQVRKDITAGLFYKNMEDVYNAAKYDSFRATMTYKF